MSDIKGLYFPVLDKGFVSLVDVMGNDDSIVQAARVSYGKGTKSVQDDRGLIRYLMRHKHTTPLEMVELKFHVGVPMDCWRQWIRHRMASVNEYSTRYSEAIDLKQETQPIKWRPQSKTNKQGSEDAGITEWPESYINIGVNQKVDPATYLSEQEKEFHKNADVLYKSRLEFGVAKEQARKDLPLSTYTVAYWKIDLHNLLHFLKLRCDSHAQLEIRSYANVLAGMVKAVCPLAFEAWYDYSFMASNFTRLDKQLLGQVNRLVCGRFPIKETESLIKFSEDIGMSKREYEEFWKKISVPSPQAFDLDISKAVTGEFYERLYS